MLKAQREELNTVAQAALASLSKTITQQADDVANFARERNQNLRQGVASRVDYLEGKCEEMLVAISDMFAQMIGEHRNYIKELELEFETLAEPAQPPATQEAK
jgi:hypothetical protein